MSANEKPTSTILNSSLPDSSSKLIFDEPLLCAQFLRGYIKGIPCLADIRPEDIEDVSDQYVPLFSEERNSDRVKKVHIKNGTPFFLISLIEHKTKVEYNIHMQIFRYMIYIWESYEKEEEKRKKGISRLKEFKYPPILPIVYYEGRQEWTAPLDFMSRITNGKAFDKYIPDFHYYLVPLRKYSNQELLDRNDEISLVMLINKLQELRDISSFRSLPQEKLTAALKDTPDHIAGIIADILLAFLLKSRIPANEAEDIAGKVREKKMGELFADMESIDIPAEQAKIRQQKEELESERQNVESERLNLESEKQNLESEKRNMESEKRNVESEKLKLKTEWQDLMSGQMELEADRTKLDTERQELEQMRQEIQAALQQIKNT